MQTTDRSFARLSEHQQTLKSSPSTVNMQTALFLLATAGSLASAGTIKYKNEPHLTITLFNEQDCIAKVEPIDINHTHHVGKCWTKDVGFHSLKYTIDPKHSHMSGRTCHVDIWQGPKCQGPAQKGGDILLEVGSCRNTDHGLPADKSGLAHSYMVMCDETNPPEPEVELELKTIVFTMTKTKRDLETPAPALAQRDDDFDASGAAKTGINKGWHWVADPVSNFFDHDRRDAPAPTPTPAAEPTIDATVGEGGVEVVYISAEVAPSATKIVAFSSEDGYEHVYLQGVPADFLNDE
ncbi:hypothetical protein W97_07622 [Coniosporium apollinis CBS 100218]|uniref:Uncharacterized protein n=1 Tax=Coniosporium apollinis (strain CBS 100218) TaxID=1168221 RepID=R7Z2W0_CONA1|nr:uncharacterized protein W97_07622 [Coniosporium apollinis CBS 100218]EON68364.1 hypothetical protein W97_07622 [Coniosporium apollinis CBS 100218]